MNEEQPLWQLHLHRTAATTTFALAGELDLQSADDIRTTLIEEAHRPATTTLVIDLAQVTFLDSTVLGCFINGYYAAQQAGRTLTIVNPSPAAHRVLSITGLLALLAEA
ncbi:STAS domain-containing protein [Actinoplanes sp. NPDC051859]|uniref:STAS domain-containing protein n=1 Tax=Actinoplanes sp. NPDC051859 TaxID=3363909 RepID=UPI0037A9B56F